MRRTEADQGRELAEILGREFYKDDLPRREHVFQHRPYDRTVHPTQMYSIQTEAVFERIIGLILHNQDVPLALPGVGGERTVERILRAQCCHQLHRRSRTNSSSTSMRCSLPNSSQRCPARREPMFLSFWGDWDGSNRPSGQGHRLIASVLVENVTRLSRLVAWWQRRMRSAGVDPKLLGEIEGALRHEPEVHPPAQ